MDVPGDKDSRWLGQTASWYIDAVKEPWSKHYQMYSYVSKELPELVIKHFPVRPKFGICGHRYSLWHTHSRTFMFAICIACAFKKMRFVNFSVWVEVVLL